MLSMADFRCWDWALSHAPGLPRSVQLPSGAHSSAFTADVTANVATKPIATKHVVTRFIVTSFGVEVPSINRQQALAQFLGVILGRVCRRWL
jgi:hypothetical protein